MLLRRSCLSSPTTRCAATSKPDGSKICEPMCECSPISAQSGQRQHPADRLGRVPAGEREAELLVLVRGGDELVGVRLHTDGDPDHHRHRIVRAVLDKPGQPGDLVERVDDDGADAVVARPAPARRRTCWSRAARSGRAGSRPAAPAAARRTCRRPGTAPRRRASARSRCTGTPCRRSARCAAPPKASAKSWQRLRKSASSMTISGVPWAGSGRGRRRRPGSARPRRSGPHRAARPRVEPVQVGGRAVSRAVGVQFTRARPRRVGPHIRSGASTPSTASPFASTWRVAAHSHSRATVTVRRHSRSASGSTRTES